MLIYHYCTTHVLGTASNTLISRSQRPVSKVAVTAEITQHTHPSRSIAQRNSHNKSGISSQAFEGRRI